MTTKHDFLVNKRTGNVAVVRESEADDANAMHSISLVAQNDGADWAVDILMVGGRKETMPVSLPNHVIDMIRTHCAISVIYVKPENTVVGSAEIPVFIQDVPR